MMSLLDYRCLIDFFESQSNWNVDTLSGGSSSKFTRNGTPEPLNPAKINVYRFMFGGAGTPIYYQVLSPDGEWVTFHILKHPNLTAGVYDMDVPISLHIVDEGIFGAPAINIVTTAWGASVAIDDIDNSSSETLTTTINDTILINTIGCNILTATVNTTTTGSIIFESSIDGVNWISATDIITSSGNSVSGSITPTSGTSYRILCTGWSWIRVRTTATLGASVKIYYNLDQSSDLFLTQTKITQRNVIYHKT